MNHMVYRNFHRQKSTLKILGRNKALQFKTQFDRNNNKYILIPPYVFNVSYEDKV